MLRVNILMCTKGLVVISLAFQACISSSKPDQNVYKRLCVTVSAFNWAAGFSGILKSGSLFLGPRRVPGKPAT